MPCALDPHPHEAINRREAGMFLEYREHMRARVSDAPHKIVDAQLLREMRFHPGQDHVHHVLRIVGLGVVRFAGGAAEEYGGAEQADVGEFAL